MTTTALARLSRQPCSQAVIHGQLPRQLIGLYVVNPGLGLTKLQKTRPSILPFLKHRISRYLVWPLELGAKFLMEKVGASPPPPPATHTVRPFYKFIITVLLINLKNQL